MTLREKIQESIINAGNNFYYDSEYSLNRILDNATFPTAFMYLFQDSGVDRVGTQMLDRCNAQIVFSDLQDFDNTAITTDDIIEDCILKAKHWLSTLQQNSNLELIQITSTKRIYSTFDVQLCGYMVNVQIRERYENKDCINQPLTILETLSQHAQLVATGTQLGHIRSGGDISVDEYGMVTVLNGGGKEWQLQFFNQADIIQLEATSGNIAIFASGVGTDVGSIEVSNDGVTYIPLLFPFSPSVGSWFFKRSVNLVTGVYTIYQ